MRRLRLFRLCLPAAALLVFGSGLSAQTQSVGKSSRSAKASPAVTVASDYRLALPVGFMGVLAQQRVLPALNGSTPSGFGPSWGDVFIGVGYQGRTRPMPGMSVLNDRDGAVVGGFGLGSSRLVGLEVAVTSFSTIRSGFFSRGGVSFKLHHAFPDNVSVAVGRETAIVFGGTGDGGRSSYAVVSKIFFHGEGPDTPGHPFSAVGLTFGIGDGRYRPTGDINAGRNSIGVFGAASVRLAEPLGVVADWNGQDLTLAASFVPLHCAHLVITPGITDVTNNAGSPARFILSVGLGERFTRHPPRAGASCI